MLDSSITSAHHSLINQPSRVPIDEDFRRAAQLEPTVIDARRKPPPPYPSSIQIGSFRLELDQIGEEEIL